VSARVGLAEAVREYVEAGPSRVWRRLDEVGRLARDTLAATPRWRVVDEPEAGSAIVALRPTDGQDVTRTRHRLLDEHRILTTASLPARAPRDMDAPLLRVSPHVDCTTGALERLRAALSTR
jgi:pyridoxal 5-phosphate dependent beta-lyase